MPVNMLDLDFSSCVHVPIYFLARDDRFTNEKPYAFRFALEEGPIPQSNMKMERKENIPITDIRGHEKHFSLERNGFEVLSHTSKLAYEEFYHPEKIHVYLRELETLLQQHLKATCVKVFRYGVRMKLSPVDYSHLISRIIR